MENIQMEEETVGGIRDGTQPLPSTIEDIVDDTDEPTLLHAAFGGAPTETVQQTEDETIPQASLLSDDELLRPREADENLSEDDSGRAELVEFEIVIDGEVVGSTFLPKRGAPGIDHAEQALQAKATALKQERKRKFDARMGYDGDTTSGSPAAADGLLPMPDTKCASCQVAPIKYRCPKCDVGSCSLPCVVSHKTRLNCTGVRSRSSYVPLARMDERTLQNDVAFLTEVERLSGAASRDPIMKDQRGELINLPAVASTQPVDGAANLEPSAASLFSCTPSHLASASYTLMSACTQYRGIKLMCMPVGMKMHTENASRVYALGNRSTGGGNASLTTRDSVIRWTCHLYFKHRALTSDGPNSDLKIVRRKIDERLKWSEVLDSILAPQIPTSQPVTSNVSDPASASTPIKKSDEVKVQSISTAVLRHQLAAFTPRTPTDTNDDAASSSVAASNDATMAASRYAHLRLLYPVPFQSAAAPRYYSLNLSDTILHSLAHKVLIEHPVLHVVTRQDWHRYTLEPEPVAPTIPNKTPAQEAKAIQPRKKRKTDDVKDDATSHTAATPSAPVPMSDVHTSTIPPVHHHPPSSRGSSHGGRGRGGSFGRGGSRGRGRGASASWQHDRPQYSFGVTAPPAPPPPARAKPPTPALFKKWA